MGILDRILGRKDAGGGAKRKRGPRRTADERLKEEKLRYLYWIKRNNPTVYSQLMTKELSGVGMEDKDDLGDFISRIKQFQSAGLLPKKPEGGDDRKEWIEAGFVALSALMSQNRPPQPQVSVSPQYQQPPQVYQTPAQPQLSTPAQPQGQPVQQEESMSIMSHIVISSLQSRDPDQAALWLLSMAQSFPTAKPIVDQLCATPDAELPGLLTAAASQYKDLAPAMTWLNDPSRRDWLYQTMAAVRRYNGADAGPVAL